MQGRGDTSFEPRSWRGVLDTTLCDKVCPPLWFLPPTKLTAMI